MNQNKRILSIDVMRGVTLFLMLFVNDLYAPGVPKWLVHTKADIDGIGLADWVFPGFLFMVGLSIPFAIKFRENSNQTKIQLLHHIFTRTISLLIIGIFMVNASENYNAELTGVNKTLWVLSGYLSVFLIWYKYPNNSKIKYLKYFGISLFAFLAIIFKGGTIENPIYIQKAWWGILGLIGWGYFSAALTYFFLKDKLKATILVWVAFLILNIISQLNLLSFSGPFLSIFGVVLSGNVPFIVISGLLTSIFLIRFRDNQKHFMKILLGLSVISFLLAAILNQWFIFSKIQGTPSWALLCNGISFLLFVFFYYLIDFKNKVYFLKVFLPAGQNSLSTYLIPDVFYYMIWALPFHFLFYKQEYSQILAVSGSLVWAFFMTIIPVLLVKFKIRLKL